ncbi:MAG: DUF4147 domain-containing protein [Gemmatimonadota bacterium]|nr:MAG: DUF4147 domain-containing protein [Gemmatimonadota bacterium]
MNAIFPFLFEDFLSSVVGTMIITNKDEVASSELRTHALDIIEAGIHRVLPEITMNITLEYDSTRNVLKIQGEEHDLSQGRLFVIGGGKAAGRMADVLLKIMGKERITDGVINCVDTGYDTQPIHVVKASHPIPDDEGLYGVERMLTLKGQYSINEKDTVLCLISGGGSALMPSPVDGIDLDEKKQITKLLLGSGAEIYEINAVRKHLSRVKGGRLGEFFSPATVISLIISDVIGNDLDVIASGPTYPDSSTFSDAYAVLEKYGLILKAPKNIVTHLEKGIRGEIEETPKKLNTCYNYIIGENGNALEAMAQRAKDMGYSPYIVTAEQKGDPARVAQYRAGEIQRGVYEGYDVVLIGGETTPKLPENPGKGGRNQHYAAASLLAMRDYEGDWVVVCVGTDGSDYLPDVAGVIVDKESLVRAKGQNIDVQSYIDRYDSNTLFNKIGASLVRTGNTGTNVGDVIIYILA